MRDNKSLYELIKNQLEKEQAETDTAEEITKIVFPILDSLTRSKIVNPVVLKMELAKLDPKYRDEVFGLLRLAIAGGPEGSFIILDAPKVLALLDMVEESFVIQDEQEKREEKQKEDKKKKEQEALEEELPNQKNSQENKSEDADKEKDEDKKKKEQDELAADLTIQDYEDEISRDTKVIIGMTRKIVAAIRSLALAKLSALCHLVNDTVHRKVVNVPSPQGLKQAADKAVPLSPSKEHSR